MIDERRFHIMTVIDDCRGRSPNGVELDFSRPGTPTDNAFIEAFNARVRSDRLNAIWLLSLADAANG